jgi:TRAP-type C4-dicarboxylate transport system substrate-binding protein
MFVVMNKAKWTALSPRMSRTFSKRPAAKWIDVHGMRWDQGDQEGREYATSLGNEILQLETDEARQWKEKGTPHHRRLCFRGRRQKAGRQEICRHAYRRY